MAKLRVVELFAGVGGFALGLTTHVPEASKHHTTADLQDNGLGFHITLANQWEPATKKRQHAFEVYRRRFTPTETEDGWINEDTGERSVCVDVNELASPEMDDESVRRHIPEHELLVGGFPCQDYSVARTLRGEGGIRGKKGVLWWNIHKIVEARKPRMVLLENVDRLLKSPSTARGRDFAIMLRTLEDLGYVTEWRVINAADYGMPQRRRRVFILARRVEEVGPLLTESARRTHLLKAGPFATAFPCLADAGGASPTVQATLDSEAPVGYPPLETPEDITEHFERYRKQIPRCTRSGQPSPYMKAGIHAPCADGTWRTTTFDPPVVPHAEAGWGVLLGDIILTDDDAIPEAFWVSQDDVDKDNGWMAHKGGRTLMRTSAEGHQYRYSEGGMVFPDPLDRPARTIITGEGGGTPSRFKHVVETPSGRLRRLVPIELERANQFPDDWTVGTDELPIVESKRAFLMGNALVVGVVRRLAPILANLLHTGDEQ